VFITRLLVPGDLDPDHHRAEVVPARPDDLRDVVQEESDIAERQPEVEEPGRLVTAEQGSTEN